MNWKDVNVLVTGAGGFIGSHLVEKLSLQGANVRAFIRYNSRQDIGLLKFLPEDLLRRTEVVAGDLRDESAVLATMEGCQYVFHLGALISIPYSYFHPREVIENNILTTLNVLEGARRTRPQRLIHTSTSEVYGTAKTVPISEVHPLQGQSPYSASKIGADKIVESYYRAFDVPVVTVRPFNTYGPRQSARAVIPTIITQVLTSEHVQLGALYPTRDFTFVEDTVRGFLCAAEYDRAMGMEINLGTGEEISIKDLAEKIIGLASSSSSIVVDEERLRPAKSEVDRLCADNSLASTLLNWQPSISLDDGLRRTLNWISDHLDLYRIGEYQI